MNSYGHKDRRNTAGCTICRSRNMSVEEIEQERNSSGWNPYWAEEEAADILQDERRNISEPEQRDWRNISEPEQRDWRNISDHERGSRKMMPDPQQNDWGLLMGNDPSLEEPRMAERDLRQLQFMYPDAAKMLLPQIEEECDKMEYAGSPMYDQYPDKNTMYRITDRIYEKVKTQFPPQPPVERDEMLSMQHRGTGHNVPGRNWVKDLIQVLLLNEIHHRRCRYGQCRRSRR